MRKRNVIAITGTRSDYGPMRPVYRAIEQSPELKLGLIVTGMHLSPIYGMSVNEIKKDRFPILRKISSLIEDNTGFGMSKGLGLMIISLSQAFDEINPDVLLLQGDRGEMLAGAIVAAHSNIPIVHMSGGDKSGSIDESIRNAITKFSHIHLVTCEQSAEQVSLLGENSSRIYVVGEPTLDVIRTFSPIPFKDLIKKYHLNEYDPFILMIQHSVTSEIRDAAEQIRETLEALIHIGIKTIICYPNSDAGGLEMIRVLDEYANNELFTFSRNMPHEEFLSLMMHAQLLVGNSSSGIIEAPSFKLPAINIGTRQMNRVHACNIVNAEYNRESIERAIVFALNDNKYRKSLLKCKNPYGDGYTAEKTVEILSKLKITEKLTAKWI